MTELKPPFPYFGGKSKVADEVWARFGPVKNYVEPFFGSGAVLLGRPKVGGVETVNDLDGFVANFWRSMQHAPDVTAKWADQPVNENDLHARHVWLVSRRETLRAELEGDPDFYDPKIAGWWVWGLCSWIGSGWCSGKGPWWPDDAGQLVHGNKGQGVNRQLPHLGNKGQGVNRKLPHLGGGRGVNRQLPHLRSFGQGVNRKRPHLGDNGRGVNRQLPNLGDSGRLTPWFDALSARLRDVRVCSGDWSRVCGPTVTFVHGLTGVFLDPPYADTAGRTAGVYAVDDLSVAHDVREWAIVNGDNPLMRIALCGYEGEHVMPSSWAVHQWSAVTGFGGQADERTGNNKRERIWFSPHCISQDSILNLFGDSQQG